MSIAKKPARKPAAKTTPIPVQLAPASTAAELLEPAAPPVALSAAKPAVAGVTADSSAKATKKKLPKAAQKAGKAQAAKTSNAKTSKDSAAAASARAQKEDKARKSKLVRDSFTIPKNEYAVLDALKQRAAGLGRPAKKSEVLRAGVQALAAMGDAAFLACVSAVPAVKTGRPAKA